MTFNKNRMQCFCFCFFFLSFRLYLPICLLFCNVFVLRRAIRSRFFFACDFLHALDKPHTHTAQHSTTSAKYAAVDYARQQCTRDNIRKWKSNNEQWNCCSLCSQKLSLFPYCICVTFLRCTIRWTDRCSSCALHNL